MKWVVPPFAQIQPRFIDYGVPPDSNANFAFVLTALDWIDEKAAFLLPNGVLSTENNQEAEIRKQLIERNTIEAVIMLPDKMFESTSIPTCILLLNKAKKTMNIEMLDMRQEYEETQRDQRGQFGGASHEGRTYHKTIKVITESGMAKAIKAISEHNDIDGFCKSVSISELRANGYTLTPSRYIGIKCEAENHRPYSDIASDYNRIVREKNALKLTVNESLAKSLGLYEIFVAMKNAHDLSDTFSIVGQTAEKESFIQLSKNAAEFKIENRSKDKFPEILSLFLQMWKQHIMYLNNEENRLLAEFRDALLPELMSGKIELSRSNGGDSDGTN